MSPGCLKSQPWSERTLGPVLLWPRWPLWRLTAAVGYDLGRLAEAMQTLDTRVWPPPQTWKTTSMLWLDPWYAGLAFTVYLHADIWLGQAPVRTKPLCLPPGDPSFRDTPNPALVTHPHEPLVARGYLHPFQTTWSGFLTQDT